LCRADLLRRKTDAPVAARSFMKKSRRLKAVQHSRYGDAAKRRRGFCISHEADAIRVGRKIFRGMIYCARR